MRFIIIVILVVACGWLLVARQKLNESTAALVDQLGRSRERVAEAEKKLAVANAFLGQLSPENARIWTEYARVQSELADSKANTAVAMERARAAASLANQPKQSWLMHHVEKGSKALDNPPRTMPLPSIPGRIR